MVIFISQGHIIDVFLSPWLKSSKIHPCEKIYSRIASRVVKSQGGEIARDLEGGALRPSEGKMYEVAD